MVLGQNERCELCLKAWINKDCWPVRCSIISIIIVCSNSIISSTCLALCCVSGRGGQRVETWTTPSKAFTDSLYLVTQSTALHYTMEARLLCTDRCKIKLYIYVYFFRGCSPVSTTHPLTLPEQRPEIWGTKAAPLPGTSLFYPRPAPDAALCIWPPWALSTKSRRKRTPWLREQSPWRTGTNIAGLVL